jgi:Holliday junction resolvasome RuvABC DNA-binding subunit
VRLAGVITSKVAQRLVGDEANQVTALDPSSLSVADLRALLDAADRLAPEERSVLEMALALGYDRADVEGSAAPMPVQPASTTRRGGGGR